MMLEANFKYVQLCTCTTVVLLNATALNQTDRRDGKAAVTNKKSKPFAFPNVSTNIELRNSDLSHIHPTAVGSEQRSRNYS